MSERKAKYAAVAATVKRSADGRVLKVILEDESETPVTEVHHHHLDFDHTTLQTLDIKGAQFLEIIPAPTSCDLRVAFKLTVFGGPNYDFMLFHRTRYAKHISGYQSLVLGDGLAGRAICEVILRY